ncbi:MAG: Na+/H+ antiporter subunit A, partial [Actinomycetota bacterium]|nr:Na+/H+ antiporter subunit A [Actinomycetota bacterium]
MLFLLIAHAVAALGAPTLVRLMGRRAFWVLALVPAGAAGWALSHSSAVMRGEGPVEVVQWIPGLDLQLAFELDTLSWFMALIVGAIGAVVLVYCSSYFSATASGMGRFGGVLVAFAGAMLGLVVADDMLLLFIFWELTTVFSYLLIGHYADRKASRRAAMQAIVITTGGGLAMLVGVIILGDAAGTYRLSELLASPPTGTAVTAAAVLVLVGAVTKSALIPLHFWLPAAMAAPTPVSAYLHAAAMVKAGVYLVARFAPAFAELGPWRAIVISLGLGSLLLGGYRALRQNDLKLVLAFGTVSQLGLLVFLVGLGTQAAALAGLAMIGAHALFKAALFLIVGVVDSATGTRDLRRLSGVGRTLPITATAGALATASMIGLPPFAGYVAKEAALEAVLHGDLPGPLGVLVVVGVALGSALTVAYGLRFWWGAFARKATVIPDPDNPDDDGEPQPAPVSRPSLVLVWPALALAVGGLAIALVPHLGQQLLMPYAATMPMGEPGHLVLWAGLTPALGVTVAILAVGFLLFLARGPVGALQTRVHVRVDADSVYRRSMRRLDDFAADLTAFVQRGSLPFYVGSILAALVIVPGSIMLARTAWPTEIRLWDRPAQGAAAAVVIIAAILAARSRRRLKAVILLGVSGFGVALFFLLHGAPDLALTQVLVETVTLVVFVLVLRRIPPYFSDRPLAASRWLRLGIGVAAGVTVAGFALVAPSARIHEAVSVDFAREALEYGGGKNIVNVALVDIRAWDTMGEISVLLVAATGVASLVFVSRRSGSLFRAEDASDTASVWAAQAPAAGVAKLQRVAANVPSTPANAERYARMRVWIRAGSTLAPGRRSVIFEVVTRLLFHLMILYAIYLLFSGHNAPGGGFAAGLVVGIALMVRYLAGGRYELGEAAPVHPGLLLGTGLF